MNWNDIAQWTAIVFIYLLLAAHRTALHPNAPRFTDLRRRR